LLLIVAGVLLLLSVVAFLINDVEHDPLRRAADMRDRQAVLEQVQRVMVELNALKEERERHDRQRDELRDRNEAVLES
jgi:hypothetical protein